MARPKIVEEKVKGQVMGKIIACSCKSEYQDSKYGKGRRWYNQRQGDKKKSQYTCTVCGSSVSQ
jgi:hypothetical protein